MTEGYRAGGVGTRDLGTVAFFPVYPLPIRLVASVIGNVFVSGLLISNLSLLVAPGHLYALVRREFDDDAAAHAVLFLAAAPASVFLSAMYAESLFLALSIATFYYASRGRWPPAALLGATAAATRNAGVFLAVVIALEATYRQGVRLHPSHLAVSGLAARLRRGALASGSWRSLIAAFVSLGVFGYMAYLGATFGDPLAFIHAQATFGRDASGLGLLRLPKNALAELGIGPDLWSGQVNPSFVLDTLFAVVFALLVVLGMRTLRPGYTVYAALSLLAPLTSGATSAMMRYTLMLVPCFILLALWGRRPWVNRVILVISLPLMAYVAVTFSHGFPPV